LNDLSQIKEEIYNCGYIIRLLEAMGCEEVEKRGNRYEAARPGGNNNRSVQVYDDESLSSRVRTKASIPVKDIYDLVSYIKFGIESEDGMRRNIPKSKEYIVSTLGLKGFNVNKTDPKDDPNAWLKEIRDKRKKRFSFSDYEPNLVLDEDVLNEFIPLPHELWIQEGLTYSLQQEFEVGYDVATERITLPIRGKSGSLIGVKGRTTKKEDEDRFKYLPIYAFKKSQELFNLHRALPYIIEKKEIICFEAEKSCIFAHGMDYKHCVSQMGSEITKYQAEMIKAIVPDIKVILAYDKGISAAEVQQMAKIFGGYENLYAIFDTKDLLTNKQSPVDSTKEIWERLYNKHCYKIPSK
jgi:DNA primase